MTMEKIIFIDNISGFILVFYISNQEFVLFLENIKLKKTEVCMFHPESLWLLHACLQMEAGALQTHKGNIEQGGNIFISCDIAGWIHRLRRSSVTLQTISMSAVSFSQQGQELF